MGIRGSKQKSADITAPPPKDKSVKRKKSKKDKSNGAASAVEEVSIQEKREETPKPVDDSSAKAEVSPKEVAQSEAKVEEGAGDATVKETPEAIPAHQTSTESAPAPEGVSKEEPVSPPPPSVEISSETKIEETIVETKQESTTLIKEEDNTIVTTHIENTTVSKEESIVVRKSSKDETITMEVKTSESSVDKKEENVESETIKPEESASKSEVIVATEEKIPVSISCKVLESEPESEKKTVEVSPSEQAEIQESIPEAVAKPPVPISSEDDKSIPLETKKEEEIKTIIEVREDNVTIVEVNSPPPPPPVVTVEESSAPLNGLPSSDDDITSPQVDTLPTDQIPIKIIEATPSPEELKQLSLESEPITNHISEQNGPLHNGTVIEEDEQPAPTSVEKRPTISFTFGWSETAKKVAIAGSFTQWDNTLQLEESDGKFSLTSSLPEGLHYYKFLVDGEWTVNKDFPTTDLDGHGLVNVLDVKVGDV